MSVVMLYHCTAWNRFLYKAHDHTHTKKTRLGNTDQIKLYKKYLGELFVTE